MVGLTLAAVISCVSCTPNAVPAPLHLSGGIEGQVVDTAGRPIRNASLYLLGKTPRGLTDWLGHYAIDSLRPQEYDVRAAMIGYCSTTNARVQAVQRQRVRSDFVLREPPCTVDTAVVRGVAARQQRPCRTSPKETVKWAQVEAVRGIEDLPPARFGAERAPQRGTLVRAAQVCRAVLQAYNRAARDTTGNLERAFIVRLDTGTLALLLPQNAGWVYFDSQYGWRGEADYLD
jgi:hypothetical protein